MLILFELYPFSRHKGTLQNAFYDASVPARLSIPQKGERRTDGKCSDISRIDPMHDRTEVVSGKFLAKPTLYEGVYGFILCTLWPVGWVFKLGEDRWKEMVQGGV